MPRFHGSGPSAVTDVGGARDGVEIPAFTLTTRRKATVSLSLVAI